ncbi:MAG: hypothetical protein LJF04_17305 [Gemmatimonadetes bacterium]|nr:hypothetical protein [Gemmatimonadota bacterium]
MFPMLLLPFLFLFIVPVGLMGVLFFRRRHGCDACTATHYWCARRATGKSCPFFE